MEYHSEKKEIITHRILNELDQFAIEFTQILEKYMEYVIISGYVSILLGRTRATEDIDVWIKKVSREKFLQFYKEAISKGVWCINAEDGNEVFNYLINGDAVRFARDGKAAPNFEIKFPKRKIDEETFTDSIKVILKNGKLRISSLERQIAFKRYYLGTEKDIEDSEHIEETFKGQIDYNKVEKLKPEIEKKQIIVNYPKDEDSYPDILIDPKKLKEAIAIFINNAVKYNKENGQMEKNRKFMKPGKTNREDRQNFIKFWAEYIKSHTDEDWSEQQNIIINSQLINSSKNRKL